MCTPQYATLALCGSNSDTVTTVTAQTFFTVGRVVLDLRGAPTWCATVSAPTSLQLAAPATGSSLQLRLSKTDAPTAEFTSPPLLVDGQDQTDATPVMVQRLPRGIYHAELLVTPPSSTVTTTRCATTINVVAMSVLVPEHA